MPSVRYFRGRSFAEQNNAYLLPIDLRITISGVAFMETKKTLILPADEAGFAAAGEIIRRGGLVVFPTETVYGLGANALDAAACAKIFVAKGRPQDNPLIVHTADVLALARLAREVPPRAALLIKAFMPGPLTLILPKTEDIPPEVTSGLSTVGLRVPANLAAQRFLRAAGVPVAAPSANLSGRPSPTTFAMACAAMEGRADAIIHAEDARVGLESTIVRVSEHGLEILRPGGVSEEELASVVQDCPVHALCAKPEGPPPAPGMKYTHYKPKADVLLYRGPGELHAALGRRAGKKTGVLALGAAAREAAGRTENGEKTETAADILVREIADAAEYARRLYAEFFMFDALGCELILAEYPPENGIGRAVANRLLKASGAQRFDYHGQ
jgi:L-threonylcarbamoyladenylate synthase